MVGDVRLLAFLLSFLYLFLSTFLILHCFFLASHYSNTFLLFLFLSLSSGKICGALWIVWISIGLIFAALLALVIDQGKTVYFVYLTLWVFFILMVSALVFVGGVERRKEEAKE